MTMENKGYSAQGNRSNFTKTRTYIGPKVWGRKLCHAVSLPLEPTGHKELAYTWRKERIIQSLTLGWQDGPAGKAAYLET